MGYCIELSNHNFTIKKENAYKIVKALKNYALNKQGRISWVDKNTLINSSNIEESFEEINFPLVKNKDEDYIIDYFSGENFSDDYYPMFKAIAPYVEDSYIEIFGHDGEKWRWIFKNGECEEKYPEINWD